MGANRTTFEKLQRDRAKKAKAAAKRERRMGLQNEPATATEEPATSEWTVGESEEPLSAAQLLEAVEQLHRQYESKTISFDEFEERKTDLLARITVD
ncbi:hypothetical protein [Actinomarinicola tropica]|uniref:SHOCT domain-containing protein n=1 Tax=Actinomarinicola tropica TaxID=2789776 RepID=A0A5Q2RLC9_9ACTN|nr:hypothetical protein [Actinomarinicola tropica]QGG95381.1 hypothetical protein GH723_09885 [Actinomarinicola tropica]